MNLYGFVGNDGVGLWDFLGCWDREKVILFMCQSEKGQAIIAALDKVIVMKSEFARSRRRTRASVNDNWGPWEDYDWGAMTDENDKGKMVIHIPQNLSDQEAAVAAAHESAHADGSQKGYSSNKKEVEAFTRETEFSLSVGLPPEQKDWIWDKELFPEENGAVNKMNILIWVKKAYAGYYASSELVQYVESSPRVPEVKYGKETVEAPWKCPEACDVTPSPTIGK